MNKFKYTDDQKEIVEFLFNQIGNPEGENVIVSGAGGTGKAQPDDTIIPTPRGFKRLDELCVGDEVFNLYGKPTKVIGVFPQGFKKCYEMRFENSRRARCCKDHLWSVLGWNSFETKSLKDIMTGLKKGVEYSFPSAGIVEYFHKTLPLDPYQLGESLGRVAFDSIFGGKVKEDDHIPQEYLMGDLEQRLSLLRGLFDKNSLIEKRTGSIRFASTSKRIANEVTTICYGLGCHVEQKVNLACYEINISGPRDLLRKMVSVPSKIAAINSAAIQRVDFSQTTLCEVVKLGKVSMRCIAVDSPEHIYLTEDFVPTHNTTMVCQFIGELIEKDFRVAVTAMTGKATAVLRSKIEDTLKQMGIRPTRQNLMIETVSKLTKESIVLGITDEGETAYTNKWRDPKIFAEKFDVLFVDELSMVPHFIAHWWILSGVRVFGFGDACQLPEVSTGETKKELSGFKHDLKIIDGTYVSGYGIKALKGLAKKELFKVLRSDNDIALLCNELRDFTQSKVQFLSRFKEWAAKSKDIEYSTSATDIPLNQDSGDWQIICYTNKMAQKINNRMCLGGDYPDALDKIMLQDNINPLRIYNGDIIRFASFLRAISTYNEQSKYNIYVCMKWQGKMPRVDSDSAVERQFARNYVLFKKELVAVNAERMRLVSMHIKNSCRPQDQIDNWLEDVERFREEYSNPGECFTAIVRSFEDIDRDMAQYIADQAPPLPRLFVVSCDYGYAITCHKSQGSEYNDVCYIIEKFDKPLIYTGASRAKRKVRVINLLRGG